MADTLRGVFRTIASLLRRVSLPLLRCCLGDQAQHVEARKREAEPLLVGDGAVTVPQLSPAELAKILGNVCTEEDLYVEAKFQIGDRVQARDDALQKWEMGEVTSVVPLLVQLYGTQKSYEWGEVQTVQDETVPEDPEVDGKVLLDAMDSRDSELTATLVKRAGTTAINAVDDVGRNALSLACAEGYFEACKVLLGRKDFRGVNARNSTGATALHMAAGNDEVDLCKLILACPRFSLGVNVETDRGQTPLDFCIEFGEGDCRTVLEAAGGRNSSGDGQPGAHAARRRTINLGVHGVNEHLAMPTVREDVRKEVTDMDALD